MIILYYSYPISDVANEVDSLIDIVLARYNEVKWVKLFYKKNPYGDFIWQNCKFVQQTSDKTSFSCGEIYNSTRLTFVVRLGFDSQPD